jgi:hypothetical protein
MPGTVPVSVIIIIITTMALLCWHDPLFGAMVIIITSHDPNIGT